ncbi:MAG: purine-nucleoside phosphorylase [Bacteroidia bacterium]|nr:purine-nucleoside phosphorylase [Bacteroidia bacterium]
MQEKLQEAFEYVSKQISSRPKIGIVLGTGLGRLVEEIDQDKALPYNFIPHFPISTVESHFGKLIFGKIGDKEVVAMQGRFHYYEGYNMQEITFPIRMMKMLGVETLFISNASGAVNLSFQNGDLMVIDDHINLQPANPLTGPNISEFGPRFPDMSAPYDKELSARALEIAKENDIRAHIGVYVGVPGPNLETRAEYRYMRIIGGDVVGMSTVPEVIVARHMDMRVCAISVITDIGDPDNLHPISLEDVIAVANEAEPKLTHLLSTLIKEL